MHQRLDGEPGERIAGRSTRISPPAAGTTRRIRPFGITSTPSPSAGERHEFHPMLHRLRHDYDNVIFVGMGLGDLQYLTLLAVARLGDEAVSRTVRDELDRVAGRGVSVSTVFVTLTRLEDQGLLASGQGRVPAGGGRRPRVFELTEAGRRAVREARAEVERMWAGLEAP